MNEIVAQKGEVIPPDFDREFEFSKKTLVSSKHPRHIFIFLDGTWNEERDQRGRTTPTNVLRMFQEINHKTSHELASSSDPGDSSEIIAHYYRGVGNRQDNNAANRMWLGFNGADEQRIRSAAFADLYRDYRNDKDRIYILGFSRGAASARLLARDICIKGFPPKLKVHTTHFPNLLTGQIEARVDQVDREGEGKNIKNPTPKIAFLGCWDTVDAFVLPSRFPKSGMLNKIMDGAVRVVKFPFSRLFGERFRGGENEIPEGVEQAVHCVAIDETRNAFLPTLMPYTEYVEEVWFPGVHSDVGGGYDDNKLADGPYEFMKRRLVDKAKIPEKDLFKISERPIYHSESQSDPPGFCFHFHGLNTGLSHAKDILGFGTGIRRIQVLNAGKAPKEKVKPKLHNSIYSIMKSDSVFAADPRNKRTWTITYNPYNVRELEKEEGFETVSEKKETSKNKFSY